MATSLEDILVLGDLNEAERAQLLAESAGKKDFQIELHSWRNLVKEVVGESLDLFENRGLLVCYQLREKGFDDLLTVEESKSLNFSHERIKEALKRSSGLRAIGNRIGTEIDDFKEAWSIHEGEAQKGDRIEKSTEKSSKWQPVVPQGRVSWKLIAASLTILIVAALALKNFDSDRAEVIVADTQIENISLPDGSSVRLIPGSTLRYRTYGDVGFERNVELLEGKAFFDIVKSTNPFTVSTPTAKATVLGTSFGMEASRFFTEVVLAEGSVVLADKDDGNDKVILEPGQMSRVTLEGDVSRPHRVDVADALHWTDMFIFRSTELKEALSRISEYYGVDIEIEEEFGSDKINATYDYGVGVDYIVNTIGETLGADVIKTTKGFKLTN